MNDELETTEKGIINRSLERDWKEYFDAEEEFEMVKQELVMRSIRAKAENQIIPGITVRKGGTRTSNKGIDAIFEAKEWVPLKKKVNDYVAMKQKLGDEGISIPFTEQSPSVSKKKPRKYKKR